MNLNIQIFDLKKATEWVQYIQKTHLHSIFHSLNWAHVLINTYHYKPYYLIILDSNKAIALIPFMEVTNFFHKKYAVSLPFTDFCEPLILSDIDQSLIFKLLTNFGKRKGWNSIEFRGSTDYFFDVPPRTEYFHHSINLLYSEEQIFRNFSKMTQRNIIKANKSELRYEISYSLDAIKKYYKIHCKNRKHLGVPPQPFKFFFNIFQFILNQKNGFVILAYLNDRVIAGQIFFLYGNKSIYKFGASITKYLDKKPNNFLMWEAIKWLKKNKIEYLSLGRTDIGHEGLRNFKNGWGASESKLFYYTFDLINDRFENSSSYNSYWYVNIFHYLPNIILKSIGYFAYKYMG